MTNSQTITEGRARSSRMLRTALGLAITQFLDEPAIVEVTLNPDGQRFAPLTASASYAWWPIMSAHQSA